MKKVFSALNKDLETKKDYKSYRKKNFGKENIRGEKENYGKHTYLGFQDDFFIAIHLDFYWYIKICNKISNI